MGEVEFEPPYGASKRSARLHRRGGHLLQVLAKCGHQYNKLGEAAAKAIEELRAETADGPQELSPPLVVNTLVDGRTGAPASFGREICGLQPTELLAPEPQFREACAMLLARQGVLVLRFERALSVVELQRVVALFGRMKEDRAPMADGGTMPYLHYDHLGSPRVLKGTGIMEHRSGLVLPRFLQGLFKMATGQGGDLTRPFVYEGFHTDDSYTAVPAGATLLHARVLPPSGGGDTIFMDTATACATLACRDPQRLLALRGKTAVHAHNNENAFPPRPSASPSANDRLLRPRHPIVRRHHRTGVPCLYWDLDRATGEVDGLERSEGQNLLQGLQDELEAGLAPSYAHRWHEHDVLVWDNTSVQHAACGDFKEGEQRTMWRCLIETDDEPPQAHELNF